MATETELRYVIPNRLLFDRLRRLNRIGAYECQALKKSRITDYYMDTPGRAMLHQGWACRLREEDDHWRVTLKGPRDVQGSIVTRSEFEMDLPERVDDVSQWPRGEVRSQVLDLTSGLSLQSLVTVNQKRRHGMIFDGLRRIGEITLDEVDIEAGRLQHRGFMLECELGPEGELSDLNELDDLLVQVYGLIPESRSKLQRALELIEHGGSPDELMGRAVRPARVDQLCDRYGVNPGRAQRLADRAATLFAGLSPELAADAQRMVLLDAASRLSLIGEQAKQGSTWLVARNLLLHQPVEGLDDQGQATIAAAAYLARRKAKPERVDHALPSDWPVETKAESLQIIAVVRMAMALDQWDHEEACIDHIMRTDSVARVILSGGHAMQAAEEAQKRSDLWGMISPLRIEWGGDSGGANGRALYPDQARKSLGINPWDSMPEAARKAVTFHLQRMLDHEEGTRQGEDIEELHAMRVAIRRMRSAIRLFGPYIGSDDVQAANDSLRRLARRLGEVRDMDVALERLHTYAETQSAEDRQGLEPLFDTWSEQRERGQGLLVRHLDSTLYASCVRRCTAMVESLVVQAHWGTDQPSVTEVAPRFLYVYWQMVCAYDAVIKGAPAELLHALRIDCKRLRYGLEFFRDVLPERIVGLIPEVVTLQEHLGEMHDAAVFMEMIDVYTARPSVSSHPPAVGRYRAYCRHEMTRRIQDFDKIWDRFLRPKTVKAFKSLRKQRG